MLCVSSVQANEKDKKEESGKMDYPILMEQINHKNSDCHKEVMKIVNVKKEREKQRIRKINLEKAKKKKIKLKRLKLKRKKELEKSCIGTFMITAYWPCSHCSEGYGRKIAWTKSGHIYAQPYHTIAVDPTIIPYGTKLKIEGFGNTVFVAEDCGGGVKGNHIDIYMSTHAETINIKKYRKLYIVK